MNNIKIKTLVFVAFFMMLATTIMAQPLPPTTPEGNPVPVGGLSILALIAGGIYTIVKRNKMK